MSTRPIRVLLVDDDPGDAVLLRAALVTDAEDAFLIRPVDRLSTAVEAAREEPVDLVLLDLGLPDSIGLATFQAFHAAVPDVPVVILTHLLDDDLAVEAVRLGAQDYVVKGTVDELQLARTVRHAAERGRLQHDVQRMAAHQRVLAELGRLSAEGSPLHDQFARAAELMADCLGARLALVVQRRGDGRLVVQTSVGDDGLVEELLPPLLSSQLPCGGPGEPLVLDDIGSLELSDLQGTPEPLRHVRHLIVLPLRGIAWTGALVLVDTPAAHHGADTLVFARGVGMLLEETLRRTQAEFGLQERVKELSAIAEVGRLLQEQAAPEELLRAVARALVHGMQFPHRAVARLEVGDLVVVSDDGRPGLAEELTAPIVVGGARRGEVAVGHRALHGFLEGYEQQLVDAIAENVSLWLERNDTVTRIRASEAQLRSVLDQMPGLMWTVDADLRVGWHAGRAHEHLSIRPDDRAGRHLAEVFDQDHPILEATLEALAGRPSMYASTRDGRSFETRVEPLRSEDGEVVGAIGVGVDVTDTVTARRELNESRRRLEGLFNHAHDALLLADDEGRYVDANPAAARLTGYSVRQLRGMSIADITPPGAGQEDAAATFASFRSAGRMSGEWQVLTADGEVIETQFNAVADIAPGVHLSVMTDVTERKRAERAVRRSEERFRRLAENAQDVIYRLDVSGDEPRLEYVSPAADAMFGLCPVALYEDVELASSMFAPGDRGRLRDCVLRPREDPAPLVCAVVRPDGREVWIEERHSYVYDDEGRHVATEGVVRDVTARKQLEDDLRQGLAAEQAAADGLRRLNEMKDVFLTAVSHELRTPLTSLKGMSHTLVEHDQRLPEDQRRILLQRVAANADRLEELLDDLLDLDRLTRGVALLEPRRVDVAAIVSHVLEDLPTAGRPIITRLHPVTAEIDEAKVERVVENLVVNALRHTENDVPVWVTVGADGDGVGIRVEDAGPGVPEPLRDRIFDAFQMGDSPAARVGGLGIGLNLVERFVALHGGTVDVGERDGGGASFRVWLPATPDPHAARGTWSRGVTESDDAAAAAVTSGH